MKLRPVLFGMLLALPLTVVYEYCNPVIMFWIACFLAGYVGAHISKALP